MATQSNGSGDSFDMRVRAARLRVADPTLTPDVAALLAQKSYTEEETARMAGGGASFAATDPRRLMTPNPTLGQRPQLRGGGFGPSGPIDVNSYAGSRYSAANMLPATPPAAPGQPPAYAPGTVARLMQETGHDPATNEGIRREMQGAQVAHLTAETAHLTAEEERAKQLMGERAREDQAIGRATKASSPSVALAQQIMGGASFQQLDPTAAPDRAQAYYDAGGRNPGTAQSLMRESTFTPSFVPAEALGGPSGASVFRNSPKSAELVNPKPARPKNAQPEYSTDGKFYRSGPEDDWKPIAEHADAPMKVVDWMMAKGQAVASMGQAAADKALGRHYQEYRELDKAQRSPQTPAPGAAPAAAKAAPAAAKAAPTATPKPLYPHQDVQAELKRRGLTK